MVRVWYMDEEQTDPRLDHKRTPSENVSMEDLYKKTGVEYFHIDADNFRNDALLKEIREDRNYTYEDEVTISKDTLPDFEAKLKTFYTEHLHTDEEIRLVLDGSGYFDVRDEADKWIRIEVDKDDLIIIPAGIYHRFTLDMKSIYVSIPSKTISQNYIKAKRYFVGEPIWLPHNRPADDMECRKKYLHDQSKWISECAQ